MQLRLNLYRSVRVDKLSTKRYQIRKGNQLRVPRSAYNGSPITVYKVYKVYNRAYRAYRAYYITLVTTPYYIVLPVLS
jgi:hypothetical protein